MHLLFIDTKILISPKIKKNEEEKIENENPLYSNTIIVFVL